MEDVLEKKTKERKKVSRLPFLKMISSFNACKHVSQSV